MALIVQKYGGTSVGTVEKIQLVAEKIIETKKEGHQVVVVVSAMSGETNRLLALAKNISSSPDNRELDVLLSTGEQVTIALLSMALKEKGFDAISYTGGQISIQTDSAHSKARINNIEVGRVQRELEDGRIVVIAGFQGVDEHGNITTLGRGGSDTTAVAMATALSAQECRIYTDAMPDSEVILNAPISPVRSTCVPPHNSHENSPPIFKTRTTSSYFSPNNDIAPDDFAFSSGMT